MNVQNLKAAGGALIKVVQLREARRQAVIQFNLAGYNENASRWHDLIVAFDQAIGELEADVRRAMGLESFTWRAFDGK